MEVRILVHKIRCKFLEVIMDLELFCISMRVFLSILLTPLLYQQFSIGRYCMKVQGYHLDILEFSDLDGLSVHMSSESSHGQWSVHEHSAIRRKLHEYAAMSKRGAVHQWYYEEWIISINDEKIKGPATVLPVRTSMDKLVWITEVEARIARPTKSLSTINAWCVYLSDSNVRIRCSVYVSISTNSLPIIMNPRKLSMQRRLSVYITVLV